MNKDKTIDEIYNLAREALRNGDKCSTWFYDLERKDGKRWAIVFAWMDYDDNNEWDLFGKVAYQPTNSLMQEYDIDWLYPTADDGECDDTELRFGHISILKADIVWLYEQWERMRKEYVDNDEE